jgi:hypothetical protein
MGSRNPWQASIFFTDTFIGMGSVNLAAVMIISRFSHLSAPAVSPAPPPSLTYRGFAGKSFRSSVYIVGLAASSILNRNIIKPMS